MVDTCAVKFRPISTVGVALVAVALAGALIGSTSVANIRGRHPCFSLSETNGGSSDQPTQTGARSHVFVIVLENHSYRGVVGNSDAPYLNCVARNNALATRYFAVSHPSLPNYLAMIGGSTFGIASDCTTCEAAGMSLPQQMHDAGISWRAYMQDMPRRCFLGGYSGGYAKKHNPFLYFPAIVSNPTLCNGVEPSTQLNRDIHNDTLPSFSWITPNLCNDGHNCSIADSDRYLGALLPRLIRRLGPHGFLIITFDEGPSNAGCCGGSGGGRVATILAGPDVRHGARLAGSYTHYSLLRTLEDAFRLRPLRAAASAQPMRAAFTAAPRLR
jgi:hypothetical protein